VCEIERVRERERERKREMEIRDGQRKEGRERRDGRNIFDVPRALAPRRLLVGLRFVASEGGINGEGFTGDLALVSPGREYVHVTVV
jgi:hypothetical protein